MIPWDIIIPACVVAGLIVFCGWWREGLAWMDSKV